MREIKFRAWDKSERQMAVSETLPRLMSQDSIPESWVADLEFMQYTGLKDKNGKEIYEGDIVEATSELIRPFEPKHKQATGRFSTTRKVIEYREECASFCIKGSALGGITKSCCDEYYEVIGNIYENPELLTP